jgi:hypothetical protein
VLHRGLVAGAAGLAVVPAIRSIVAPDPAYAQSGCVAFNESCTPGPQANCCAGLVCCDGGFAGGPACVTANLCEEV